MDIKSQDIVFPATHALVNVLALALLAETEEETAKRSHDTSVGSVVVALFSSRDRSSARGDKNRVALRSERTT